MFTGIPQPQNDLLGDQEIKFSPPKFNNMLDDDQPDMTAEQAEVIQNTGPKKGKKKKKKKNANKTIASGVNQISDLPDVSQKRGNLVNFGIDSNPSQEKLNISDDEDGQIL